MSAPVLSNYDLDDQCYRLRLTASVAGVALDLVNLDAFPGRDHLSRGYLAKNPLGRLPTLEHDGLVLCQPAAMQLYLAGLPGARALIPADPAEQARMHDWLIFADRDLAVASAARACALMDAPGDEVALRARSRALLRLLEDHMTRQGTLGQGYVAGATLSLADLALFVPFALSRDFGIDHDDFPALRLWARRVRRCEGFITMPGIPDYH
ncbi:glutathione S-transferase family protein [Pseudooceanicola sp. CBS1P-1]|nr:MULTISPECIES: glutathione S-transferase family protein [Pseudooceanicola]MBT9385177.1 glutathione S-transferase family protein [Pseudooceanicola endophyticus]